MARMVVARPTSIHNPTQLHQQSSNTSSHAFHHHARTGSVSHQKNGQSFSKPSTVNTQSHPMISSATSVGTNSNQNTPILGSSKQLMSTSASSSSLRNVGPSSNTSAALATSNPAAAAVPASNSAVAVINSASSILGGNSIPSNAAAAPSPSLSANNNVPHINGNLGSNGNGNNGTTNGGGGGGPTFNTELRAQVRREREATREKSREKMNGNSQNNNNNNNNNAGGVSGGGGGMSGITTTTTTAINGGIGNPPAHQSTHTSNNSQSIAHHPQHHHHSTLSGRDRSASTVTIGGIGVSSCSSSSNAVVDRKISPKMNTIKSIHPINSNSSSAAAVAATSSSSHANTVQSNTNGNRVATQPQRGNVSSRNGTQIPHSSSSVEQIPLPSSNQSTPDLGNAYETLPSLQDIENVIAGIPSPPRPNQDESSQTMNQSTFHLRQYYNLLEKTEDWRRYATTMKAKADTLEIENRYLRETNRKHVEDVRALELQLRGLKETAMMLEEERRRSEDRHGGYGRPTLRHPSSQPIRRPSEVLDSAVSMNAIPSPPLLTNGRDQMISHRFPSQGSRNSCEIREIEGTGLDLRPPTSLSNLSMPSSLRNAIRQNETNSKPGSYRSYDTTSAQYHSGYANVGHLDVGQSHSSHQSSHDSNINDILYQDAQQREAAAALYEPHQQQYQRQRESEISESHSFPPSEVTKSKALTVQTLAAANRERKEAAKMNRLPSSSSAPVLRPSKDESGKDHRFSPPQHILRHQSSENAAGLRQDEKTNTKNSAAAPLHGLLRAPNQSEGRLSTVPGSRSGSVQSDAMTITEEYLQGVVEQKRQLRKISLSQQQQLHFLQARVHLSNDATVGSRSSVEGGVGHDKENTLPHSASFPTMGNESGRNSRPSSRMSNRGVRGKVRSRAGSHSLHDAIPIDKHDVFSSQSGGLNSDGQQNQQQDNTVVEHRAIRRTGSAPLGQVNLNGNRSGAMSALEFRHISGGPSDSDVSLDLEEERDRIQGLNNASFGATNAIMKSDEESAATAAAAAAEGDPKGAHRRLYMRLRDELSTEELVKFERYVHRYDALDLEMDGPKGIINRVRRLLLSEEILETKLTKRDRYQFRKELAREFERIVREDAVPSDGNTEYENSIQQSTSFDVIQPLQFSQQHQNKRSPEHAYHSP